MSERESGCKHEWRLAEVLTRIPPIRVYRCHKCGETRRNPEDA